ncbi:hypothetical protein [Burkholderia multivorans]|uniref:hypothetical protein n=1 Tax=Burkholderia multivorans TaxID=87883 RepID=UPI0009E0E026|nr:hypothetical protein [Burkholderia multivorans]SAK33253.1 hypothetical protein UA11_01910 [Burkholderia multivorans]
MIDTDKMKALAAELRANHEAMKSWMPTHQLESSPASKGADAIDTLLAALESSKQEADALLSTIAECRDKAHAEGYGESFLYEAIACPDDVPAFIGQTVTELRTKLEAAEKDAGRYRELLGLLLAGDIPMPESSVSLNVCGVPPNQDEFDEAIDFLLAQRQGEGS